MARVTKDTMIGDLLQIDQNVAPLLLNIGMHCLGCPSSQMETIEEAAMVHGLDPDDLVGVFKQGIRHLKLIKQPLLHR
jgi:hybrid cluster-associated redox disulfide protein